MGVEVRTRWAAREVQAAEVVDREERRDAWGLRRNKCGGDLRATQVKELVTHVPWPRGLLALAQPRGMVAFRWERSMGAEKATNLKLEDLPARVRAALKRRETVVISGAEGKLAELVPFLRARRRLGALAGQSVFLGDIEAPTNEPWEAMQE